MSQPEGEFRNIDQPRRAGGVLLVAFAILGAPVSWMLHFNVMYFLVQPVCRLGGEAWFHVASVVAIIAIAAAGLAAWRIGSESSATFREKLEGKGGWQGFVGAYGVAVALLFIYAVGYSWSRVFVIDACLGMRGA